MSDFSKSIESLKLVSAKDILEFINSKKEAVVFIGRETCPYCRLFAPKIGNIAKKIDNVVYFVDSQNTDDKILIDLREQYNIKTVPALLVTEESKVKVVCDSSISEEEIITFIK